jgi:hypothetical protein
LVQHHPHLGVSGNMIDVMEFLPMPGMGMEPDAS